MPKAQAQRRTWKPRLSSRSWQKFLSNWKLLNSIKIRRFAYGNTEELAARKAGIRMMGMACGNIGLLGQSRHKQSRHIIPKRRMSSTPKGTSNLLGIIRGCLGSSPLSWSLGSVSSCWTFFPLPTETLTFSFHASWTSGLQGGEKDRLSFPGNVWSVPQRAQTGGYSSSLLLQLLAQERAVEPEERWMSHEEQVYRRKPIPQCSLCLIHRMPCREDLPGSSITPRWQTAGRAASGMTLSPTAPPSRSALCQGGSCLALEWVCLRLTLWCAPTHSCTVSYLTAQTLLRHRLQCLFSFWGEKRSITSCLYWETLFP